MTHGDNKNSQDASNLFGLFWKRTVRFSEKHCWIVLPLVALITYFLFWHILADIRMVVWRQMLKDYLLITSFPIYLVIFSGAIENIYEYSLYESRQLENYMDVLRKDVHLSVWEETRYYKFLDQKMLEPCDFGSDATVLLKELRKYIGTEKEPKMETE